MCRSYSFFPQKSRSGLSTTTDTEYEINESSLGDRKKRWNEEKNFMVEETAGTVWTKVEYPVVTRAE